jgi:hypothetical protein
MREEKGKTERHEAARVRDAELLAVAGVAAPSVVDPAGFEHDMLQKLRRHIAAAAQQMGSSVTPSEMTVYVASSTRKTKSEVHFDL